jgi:hypothetical protein
VGSISRILLASAFVVGAFAQSPKLAFERLALHQIEDGPVLDPSYVFVPGETVHLSCRIRGYQLAKKDEQQRVKLHWQLRVVDPQDVLIQKEESGGIESEVLEQDIGKEKDPQNGGWLPKFLSSFVVPPFAATGTYKIQVKLKDEVAGAELSSELPFRVHGHDVEPSATLATRNFEFLRAADDKVALNPAVYHPGDMLWARFDITGYKFDQKNHFEVDYGLAILSASGQQLFAQPEAASESKESFYPQRFVGGALSLSLDSNVPKASYTLLITVRDKLGNQTTELRQPFRVE